uniref:Ig-like domain-containing protein n=1 Tax=Oncorhynchus mykiss TaxID=8022 RepID=A0A8C7T8R5_ONCMY
MYWYRQLPGEGMNSMVHQRPVALTEGPGGDVQLTCSHTIPNYYVILWYKQSAGDTAMKLIGYANYKSITMEKSFEKHFNVSGDGGKEAYLHLVSLRGPEHSAVYYCAASQHSDADFGGGTRLTVLDPNIKVTEPTVKVLAPSAKECEDRNKKKKKTLVCVATRFYPDHVTVFWQVNNVNRTEGAGTDNRALWDKDGLYSITSRLRVPANEWHKPENRFTCIVSFYDGTDNIRVNDTISGDLQGNKTMNTVCVSEKKEI